METALTVPDGRMNIELERIGSSPLKVLSWDLPGGTEANHRNLNVPAKIQNEHLLKC